MDLSTRRVRYHFVICLFFRHISSHTLCLEFFSDRYVADFVPSPPRFETISKIRGTNFDAGGVKPLPSSPHVPCLFPPLQDTSLVLKDTLYLAVLFWSGIGS